MDGWIDPDWRAKLNRALGREWPHYIKRFIQNVSEINRLQRQLHCAGFDPADIEDFIDQVEKMTTGTSDMAGTGAKGPGGTLFFNELAKSKNCVQRRAQFMAHAGKKLALGLVRSLRLLLGGM